MKRLFFLLLFFVNIFISLGQNNKHFLIGEWKVISINTNHFYFNTKTDSIYFSKKFKKIFPDSLEFNNVIRIAKSTYSNNKHIFTEEGRYYNKTDSSNLQGTYNISLQEKRININLKNQTFYSMKYKITNDILYLKISLNDKITKLLLEKLIKQKL